MTKLETVRRALGWSQKRMGDELGFSQGAICYMENGQPIRRHVEMALDRLISEHGLSLDTGAAADVPRPAPETTGATT